MKLSLLIYWKLQIFAILSFCHVVYGLSRIKVNVGGLSFTSQTAAEKYVRRLLGEIGYCNSVKAKGADYYKRLMDIAELHPAATEKLQDIQDFCIVRNKLSKPNVYELNIIRNDNSILDISWKKCVANNFKAGIDQNLKSAFRYSVDSQIKSFRRNASVQKCEICAKAILRADACHVDHVIRFDDLVKNFLLINAQPIPTSFNDSPDGSNRKIFYEENEQLSLSFSLYHQDNAVLRITCPSCNLRRKRKTTL